MNFDTLVTEIVLQKERIHHLEHYIENLIPQLIDYGMSEDSVIIISLKNQLKTK